MGVSHLYLFSVNEALQKTQRIKTEAYDTWEDVVESKSSLPVYPKMLLWYAVMGMSFRYMLYSMLHYLK